MAKSTSNKYLLSSYLIFILILIAFVGIMVSVPPTSRDALTHHLSIPKLWIENGGIHEMPHLIFSYYPMNLELLYTIPLLFGNDIVPKYIHFSFALATALLIYFYLRKRTSSSYGMLGVLIFLSIPVIVKLSISAYVDLGLIFFSWASIYYIFKWARSTQSPKYLILSGIFCGLGLGTKYNGLIVLFLLTIIVPVIYVRANCQHVARMRNAVGYSMLFLFIAAMVFSPWMIRNYHLKKNPIYPLYHNVISRESNSSDVTNLSMKPWLQRKLIYKESALETALIPLRIFFQGKDDDPRFFDGKLNPILLLCPLILLMKRKGSSTQIKLERFVLGAFSITFLLYASFMVDMRIRYVAPIIPPLVVLTVCGIREMLLWIGEIGRKRIRVGCQWVVAAVIILFLSINVNYIAALFRSVNPVPYIVGETTRDEYLRNKLSDYPAIAFANKIQFSNMKILALFLGNRLYYFDKNVEFGNQSFIKMVTDTQADNSLSVQLNKKDYTHCIIGINFLEQWADRIFLNEQKMIISHWLKEDCELLFLKNGYAVYKLKL